MCYKTGKYTVFEWCPCICQLGNFTGWDSEGVKYGGAALVYHVSFAGTKLLPESAGRVWQLVQLSLAAGIVPVDCQ